MHNAFLPVPSSSLRLLVFDLDGTLIDSGADLCASVNAMLRHFDRLPLAETVIATYIGDGAARLVSRALGEPTDTAFLDSAITYFLDYYREHKLDHTYVYPGVFASLNSLQFDVQGRRRSMAVLTNKPIGPSQAICDALGLSPYFFIIYGANSFATKKPNPEGLLALIEEAGVTPEETLMIGDSDVDVLTAQNAGAWSMGCSYGLAPHTLDAQPPDCLAGSPADWLVALSDKVRDADRDRDKPVVSQD
jgi:phosphoglycolate phosphatase